MSEQEPIIIDETEEYQESSGPIQHQDNGTIIVRLSRPIKALIQDRSGMSVEKEFSEILIRKFSFGDLKAIGNEKNLSDTALAYMLIKRLCNVPDKIFDKIEGEDMENCLEAVQSFLPTFQKISSRE